MIDLTKFEGFTEGPWSRQSDADVWCGESNSPNAPLLVADLSYRRWGREISRSERVANADLAAAAPDLLAYARKLEADLAATETERAHWETLATSKQTDLEYAERENAKHQAALTVNMLRSFPEMSHDEIKSEIEKALGDTP